jgi:hypothetical protein
LDGGHPTATFVDSYIYSLALNPDIGTDLRYQQLASRPLADADYSRE